VCVCMYVNVYLFFVGGGGVGCVGVRLYYTFPHFSMNLLQTWREQHTTNYHMWHGLRTFMFTHPARLWTAVDFGRSVYTFGKNIL
jgi:hypothetical protein